jgi:DcuC family C4-dicarboxylate transporter
VGAILIPALMSAGVPPAMAASAVMAGTFGASMSPGSALLNVVANIAEVPIMDAVFAIAPKTITALLISAFTLMLVAVVRKETSGYVPEGEEGKVSAEVAAFKVHPVKAIVPVVPLFMLIISSSAVGLFENEITIPQAMIAGVALACVVTWTDPQKISSRFFAGLGSAYGEVIGIIGTATVFTTGMERIGITGALITMMQESDAVVRVAAIFGPFIIAVLSGSGDAANLAFNNAVTPHAELFGMTILDLGTSANLGGVLGRTMSPVAGAAIVCAGLARINPIELSKRICFGMVLAATISVFLWT